MKLFTSLIIMCCTIVAYSQTVSNNLIGNYNAKNKKSLYSSLQFDGNGKVNINEMDEYEFFERNDSIIILVDKTVFVLQKMKNNELKGISEWVNGDVFKSKEKEFQYAENAPSKTKRAKYIAKYYDINFKDIMNYTVGEGDSFNVILNDLKTKNEVLCKENFDLSCVQVFVYTLTESMGGFDAIFSETKDFPTVKPDPALEALGNKIIHLGNVEGYGLLSQYYDLINDKQKAQSFKETGLELGCKLCLELEMNDFMNTLQQTEN